MSRTLLAFPPRLLSLLLRCFAVRRRCMSHHIVTVSMLSVLFRAISDHFSSVSDHVRSCPRRFGSFHSFPRLCASSRFISLASRIKSHPPPCVSNLILIQSNHVASMPLRFRSTDSFPLHLKAGRIYAVSAFSLLHSPFHSVSIRISSNSCLSVSIARQDALSSFSSSS